MADIDDILKPQGSDYNFNLLRDTTLGGLLTKFLMEHPLKNIFGNSENDYRALDSGGRTYGEAMVQDDRSGRKPITGPDGYQYWNDTGERVYPDVDKLLEEMFSRGGLLTGSEDGRGRRGLPPKKEPWFYPSDERRSHQGADGYWYYDDSGERVLPLPEDGRKRNPLYGDNYYEGTGMQDLRHIPKYLDELNISQKAKDIQNLWKGLE
tara:strand:+ start:68 stop:691 length:624 start_codon:yes stop_codon:yes gene_type:complete